MVHPCTGNGSSARRKESQDHFRVKSDSWTFPIIALKLGCHHAQPELRPGLTAFSLIHILALNIKNIFDQACSCPLRNREKHQTVAVNFDVIRIFLA